MQYEGLNFRKTTAYKIKGQNQEGKFTFIKTKTEEKIEVDYCKTNLASIKETGQYLLYLDNQTYIAPRPKIKIDESLMEYFMNKKTRDLINQKKLHVIKYSLDKKRQKFQLLLQNILKPEKGILKSYTVNSYGEVEELYEQHITLTKQHLKEFKENNDYLLKYINNQ